MSKRAYVVDLIANLLAGNPTTAMQDAELIVERLTEEGLLHLGYGNADIDLVLETFKESFGNTRTTRYDRFAANRLVQKYGSQSVAGVIKLLAGLSDQPYAPVVSNVVQLETKFPAILIFIRKQGKGSETIAT